MMKIFITMILFGLMMISCSESTDPNYDDEISLIENLGIKDAISKANEWRSTKSNIKSYVTTEELVIQFPDSREVRKNLPSNEMYVAIAPYINTTHTCSEHYISTCKAELVNKEFEVNATIGNNIILNERITSLDNGFFELWLPRNQTINVKVSYMSLTSGETIKTDKNSRTCFTTFKLE